MSRLTNEDGIDGPFERAMRKAEREDVKRPRRVVPPLADPYKWSEQGTTFGVRDRWQIRCVSSTIHITAGDNRRKSRTEFLRPSTETPWHVFERQPDPQTSGTSTKLVEVDAGIETSQEAARDAAETAAAEYIASKAAKP